MALLAGAVGGAIVAAALGLARAAAHCADVLRLDHDLDGLQTVLEIAAHGGENDDEHRLMHAVQRQIRIGGEQERADIQARTGIGGNPVLIELDNGADALEHRHRG